MSKTIPVTYKEESSEHSRIVSLQTYTQQESPPAELPSFKNKLSDSGGRHWLHLFESSFKTTYSLNLSPQTEWPAVSFVCSAYIHRSWTTTAHRLVHKKSPAENHKLSNCGLWAIKAGFFFLLGDKCDQCNAQSCLYDSWYSHVHKHNLYFRIDSNKIINVKCRSDLWPAHIHSIVSTFTGPRRNSASWLVTLKMEAI